MNQQRTLAIIKPDAVEKRKQGAILQRILDEGFTVLGMRQLRLTREAAEAFYEVHRERPFYAELVTFMTRGPVVVLALEAEDAVKRYRDLIGATDPAKAATGTIRQLYGTRVTENVVHGSDSPENGLRECAFFFPDFELR